MRHLGADLVRSQRFLLPTLPYLGVLAVLFASCPGPPPASWAGSGLAPYPVAAGVGVTVVVTGYQRRGRRVTRWQRAGRDLRPAP